MRTWKVMLIVAAVLILGVGGYFGYRFAAKLAKWRHLDRTYSEEFPSPAELASAVKGKHVLFHFKTGLKQDDSQICVGFNTVFAALEAGADVTVLFDAGATLDLDSNLASTGVPERLKKVIASQMHLPLDEMPDDYGAYLDLLHKRGARVYANTAMLIVTGEADKVKQSPPRHPYVIPATYADVVRLSAEADTVLVY